MDVETTTHNKGNPFDSRNYLVSIHAQDGSQSWSFKPAQVDEIRALVQKATTIIGFNFKFDIHWLRKLGISFIGKQIYDVQLAHYYLTNQSHKLPSLDEVLELHGLPGKVDKVKAYWDQGYQTDQIPWEILCEYGEGDVEKTYALFEAQRPLFSPLKKSLFNLACQDLLVLQEMEWNGLFYNSEVCHQKSAELQKAIQQLQHKLALLYPGVPVNFNSPDQLSAFLYGGTVDEAGKELVGIFKTGIKAGQPKYKNITITHTLPQLFKPLAKTGMAKEGIYSTAEPNLRKLKGPYRWVVDLLLELAKLTKLDETYYTGLDKLNGEMHWPKNYLHGQFNQTIAKTGRLSSSKPNLQNLSKESLDIFITRYDN